MLTHEAPSEASNGIDGVIEISAAGLMPSDSWERPDAVISTAKQDAHDRFFLDTPDGEWLSTGRIAHEVHRITSAFVGETPLGRQVFLVAPGERTRPRNQKNIPLDAHFAFAHALEKEYLRAVQNAEDQHLITHEEALRQAGARNQTTPQRGEALPSNQDQDFIRNGALAAAQATHVAIPAGIVGAGIAVASQRKDGYGRRFRSVGKVMYMTSVGITVGSLALSACTSVQSLPPQEVAGVTPIPEQFSPTATPGFIEQGIQYNDIAVLGEAETLAEARRSGVPLEESYNAFIKTVEDKSQFPQVDAQGATYDRFSIVVPNVTGMNMERLSYNFLGMRTKDGSHSYVFMFVPWFTEDGTTMKGFKAVSLEPTEIEVQGVRRGALALFKDPITEQDIAPKPIFVFPTDIAGWRNMTPEQRAAESVQFIPYDLKPTKDINMSGAKLAKLVIMDSTIATPIPEPTATLEPLPVVSDYLAGAWVTEKYGFNDNRLDGWSYSSTTVHTMADGTVQLNGEGSWDSASLNLDKALKPGTAVVVDIRAKNGPMELFVDNGTSGDADYRRVGVHIQQNSSVTANVFEGSAFLQPALSGSLRALNPEKWYRVMFAVASDGTVRLVIWDRDDPTKLLQYNAAYPELAGKSMKFAAGVHTGVLNIDEADVLAFDALSALPELPVQATLIPPVQPTPGGQEPPPVVNPPVEQPPPPPAGGYNFQDEGSEYVCRKCLFTDDLINSPNLVQIILTAGDSATGVKTFENATLTPAQFLSKVKELENDGYRRLNMTIYQGKNIGDPAAVGMKPNTLWFFMIR